jgi:hypothetical protein
VGGFLVTPKLEIFLTWLGFWTLVPSLKVIGVPSSSWVVVKSASARRLQSRCPERGKIFSQLYFILLFHVLYLVD